MLSQATDQPIAPRDDTKTMFQPLNLVIPFTVQQGELSGNNFNHVNLKQICYKFCVLLLEVSHVCLKKKKMYYLFCRGGAYALW